jgi:hypothetical protein
MTYSNKDGPEGGAPAIMPAVILSDRAAAPFSWSEEIGKIH